MSINGTALIDLICGTVAIKFLKEKKSSCGQWQRKREVGERESAFFVASIHKIMNRNKDDDNCCTPQAEASCSHNTGSSAGLEDAVCSEWM